MEHSAFLTYMFLIFTGASLFATAALYTRQSMIVAYILLGVLLGPFGLKWVDDPTLIANTADIGIIFLLFLLGLELDPKDLLHLFKNATWVTIVSSAIFAALGYGVGAAFGFTFIESLIIAAAMMFSSTIIGLKLLPTTVLHHQHTGEVVTSILLLQDLLAIVIMLFIKVSGDESGLTALEIVQVAVALPLLILFCYVVEKYVLLKLLVRFDKIKEYIFLVAIGWCLGIAELSYRINLSHEIGAFIAGIVIATSPIALFISESLKPLRDFFLILFFFALGARFNFHTLDTIWIPALFLAALALLLKPLVFGFLLQRANEEKERSYEIGIRLGQISEFSLLVAYVAHEHAMIADRAYYLIQAATVLTFIVSSYVIVMKYPTPIATKDSLRRD